jgi:hypothetical protein
MEKQLEGLHGGKRNKMEKEYLSNMMIFLNVKVFIENIIVTRNNAMLLVLMMKLLHLDG